MSWRFREAKLYKNLLRIVGMHRGHTTIVWDTHNVWNLYINLAKKHNFYPIVYYLIFRFNKGDQNWPQIYSTVIRFQDTVI